MISYDTPQVVAQKVDYIKNTHLGGAMWWETSGDKPANSSESLINIAAQGLGGYEGKTMEKLLLTVGEAADLVISKQSVG